MAFSPISSGDIDAGDPVKQELWQKTKDNFDDHESRIVTLEGSVTSFRPILFNVHGYPIIEDETLLERMNFDITVTSARLFVIQRGTGGTYTIDIEKSTDGGGSFSTIFSTLPAVAFSDGNYALSTNQVLSVTSFSAGDFMRLNFDTVQTQTGGAEVLLQAIVEFSKT